MGNTVRFHRRLADGSRFLLGAAVCKADGWRFIPNVASHKSSRKSWSTWEQCVPRWVGYPDNCESETVEAK